MCARTLFSMCPFFFYRVTNYLFSDFCQLCKCTFFLLLEKVFSLVPFYCIWNCQLTLPIQYPFVSGSLLILPQSLLSISSKWIQPIWTNFDCILTVNLLYFYSNLVDFDWTLTGFWLDFDCSQNSFKIQSKFSQNSVKCF